MPTAEVTFSRNEGGVEMALRLDGQLALSSASYETIVLELQLRCVRYLTIDGLFSTDLPTSVRTLKQADAIDFPEPLPAMRLLAACASMAERPAFPFPERRAKPRLAATGSVSLLRAAS